MENGGSHHEAGKKNKKLDWLTLLRNWSKVELNFNNDDWRASRVRPKDDLARIQNGHIR